MLDLGEQNFIPFTTIGRGTPNSVEPKVKSSPKVLAPRTSDGSVLWNSKDKLYNSTPVG